MSETNGANGRDEQGHFAVGNPGGPGRGKGGRAMALDLLDAMLAEAGNLAKLRIALQARFDLAPAIFFTDFVMPLLPKESLVRLEANEAIPILVEYANGDQPK